MPVNVETGKPYCVKGSYGYFKGGLTDIDTQTSVDCYFEYRIKPATIWHATLDNAETLTSIGEFHTAQILLLENKTYEMRSVATWNDGADQYAYGDIVEFRSSLFREGSSEDFERGFINSTASPDDALSLQSYGNPEVYSNAGTRRIPCLISDMSMSLAWTEISPANTAVNVSAQVKGTSAITDEVIGTYDYQCALEFDGVNDYIRNPSFDHNIGTGDFTISLWANPYAIGTNQSFMEISHYTTGLLFRPSAGNVQVYIRGSSNFFSYTRTVGEWAFYTLVRESGVVSLYVNAIKINEAILSGSINNGQLYIGSSLHTTGQVWKGLIDEVRFWNIARTQPQLQGNMNKRLNGNEAGLIAYYPTNEGSGLVLTDRAGAMNGTINGAIWRKRTYEVDKWIHSVTAVKLNTTATTDYLTNDREIIIDLPPDSNEPQLTVSYIAVDDPKSNDPEIQELDLDNPTDGTFKLGDGVAWTTDIAHNASVADIQAALEALYGIGNVTVDDLVYEDNFCDAATDSNYVKTEFLHRGSNTNNGWTIDEATCQLHADSSNDDLGIHTNPAIINIPESNYFRMVVEYLGTGDNDGAGILVYDDVKKEWWCGSITNDHGINGIGYYTASGGDITSVVAGTNYDVTSPHTFELIYENGTLSFYVDDIKSCEHTVSLTISGAGMLSDATAPPPYFDSMKIYTSTGLKIIFDHSVGDSNLIADFTGLIYG